MRILLKLKYLLLFAGIFLLFSLTVQGQNLAVQKINLNIDNASLKTAFSEIQKQSGVKFLYGDYINKYAATKVSIAQNNISVKDAVAEVLNGTNLSYTQKDGYIAISETPASQPTQSPARGKGSLSGTVLDEAGQPVTGVTVAIPGTTIGTATDADGKYTLRGIPEGTTKVQFALMGYETQVVSDVKINANRSTPLDIVLKEGSTQLGEVTITATYNQASANGLYAKQKNLAAMSDGVSADMIKKTSDNNVARVLKRVSGVTIDDGKYVVIRGLGERYNNVQMNGASLPSTEPNRRNFSFDIIPTALIDNVTINKTFTPDMQGEFTGGLVEVNTLAVPDERIIQVSAGTGMNTNSTGKEFMSGKRFNSDYFLGNARNWYFDNYDPSLMRTETGEAYWYQLSDEQKQKVNAMNAKIPNYRGLQRYTGAPVQNYAATVGLPFDLGQGNKLGVIASATYRHEETIETLEHARYLNMLDTLISGNRYKFITTVGAVANVGWERQGHKITWRNLFNNRFTHTNLERITTNISQIEVDQNHFQQHSNPQINRIWQTQLDGEHQLSLGLKLTWNADYSALKRTTPFDTYNDGSIMSNPRDTENDPLVKWYYTGTGGFTQGFEMFDKLEETKKNIGANLEYPFIVEGNPQKIKGGYLGSFRSADFSQKYLRTARTDEDVIQPLFPGSSLQDNFAQELFSEGKLYRRSMTTSKSDFYTGTQDIHAAYLMAEFTFFKKLHLNGGVRMEAGTMDVTSSRKITGNSQLTDTTVVRKKTDWLPAITAIYNITDELNFRAAYSRTLARPDFRELSMTEYFNVDDRMLYTSYGNTEQTSIDNFDVRLEWYPGAGEVISLSAFHKKFYNPIELIPYNPNSAGNYEMWTVNLSNATAQGLELNIRKSFGFVAPQTFLRNLYLTANASLLKGTVEYNAEATILETVGLTPPENSIQGEQRKRMLQGLAPYTLNVGLSYQGRVLGAAVNYGTTGRKIEMGALTEAEDVYEAPRHVLDLQLSARFMDDRLEIKANASDLLNNVYRVYQNRANTFDMGTPENRDRTSLGLGYNEGDWILDQYKRGVTYSLSASYKF